VSSDPKQLELWLDAPLSQHLPPWIQEAFGLKCRHLLGLGLRSAKDPAIFAAARDADVIMLTKYSDFVQMVQLHGSPPRVILLTCGNRSSAQLKSILARGLPAALARVRAGAAVVELIDPD
jgi:predicted nuclease of predicted toxin-antitoxin system